MPAVTVLPVGGTTVSSMFPGSGPDIGTKMSTKEAVGGVGSPTASRDADEGTGNVEGKEKPEGKKVDNKADGSPDEEPPSPSQSFTYPQALPAHLTPQQPGYYMSYNQSQVTPEPPSPAGGVSYDSGSFLQPTGFQNSPFTGIHQYGIAQQQQPPESPSQNTSGSMGGIPPASPLFPTVTGQASAGLRMFDASLQQRGAPTSPGPPYLSPHLGPSGASGNDFSGWVDNRSNPQNSYPPSSPQISAQGIPIPYVPGMPPRSANAAGRSYSFEENMLPPSAESQQQQQTQQQQDQNPTFTAYGANQSNVPASGGFAPQQQWGYPGGPDMYAMGASPLHGRPGMPYHNLHPGARPHMGHPYGGSPYYPATSPGPPIQTTSSNKGPEGANLFIFHIPNHFTNLDMYQLFCPYGNLLSVRIMVEKDSGRSRGFGFVSYDNRDAAALAIKELNGFAIGNKRLKVQHKQLREEQQQQNTPSSNNDSGYENVSGIQYSRGHAPPLPPSGQMAMNSSWYNNRPAQPGGMAAQIGVAPENESQNQHNNDASSNPGISNENPDSENLPSLDSLRQSLPDS